MPLIGRKQDVPGINRLEFTVAARYTDYSDFGGNTSPKFGVLWEPMLGLNIRGTYGRSFRAPFLSELDPTQTSWGLFPVSPYFPAIASRFSLPNTAYFLWAVGNNPSVGPETATNKTFGIDFVPQDLKALKFSATYFSISYRNRIDKIQIRCR